MIEKILNDQVIYFLIISVLTRIVTLWGQIHSKDFHSGAGIYS